MNAVPVESRERALRDRSVQRVILIEGSANALVFALKVGVGLGTGSLAVLGDAIHSLTDLANNLVAWFVARLSAMPPDSEHPYGHRKFETLAVFGLATLLAALTVELVIGAIRRETTVVTIEPWSLAVMLVVLSVNVVLATWENRRARQLGSDILLADARHTIADVLTTIVVIVGWQLAGRGHAWLDTACAVGVAGLVLYLSYGLFRRAVPALVDRGALDPREVARVAESVPGVHATGPIRSRWMGSDIALDLVVRVDPELSTVRAHEIADEVEHRLEDELRVVDVTVHVEPA